MLSTLTTHESIHRTHTPNTPQINPTPSPIPSASTLPPSPPSHSTPNNIINNTDHPQTSTSNTHSPSIIPTPTLSLANPQLSPQMTTRVQHGIFKPHQLFNLYTFTSPIISPLPTNLINALQDHNLKMAMKD
jgi:hypothetical protein